MNREQRRKQSKSGLIKQFLDDLSMANNMRNSVVCLKEDQTKPKWLFWIGDLTKVTEDDT